MDEYEEVNFALSQVRELLPEEVWLTCESLNGHGEWEMALSCCVQHITAAPPASTILLELAHSTLTHQLLCLQRLLSFSRRQPAADSTSRRNTFSGIAGPAFDSVASFYGVH